MPEELRKCSSCDASIIFAKTAAGKKIPLDATPVPGLFVILDGGVAISAREVYRSHFATCPHAAAHRHKR